MFYTDWLRAARGVLQRPVQESAESKRSAVDGVITKLGLESCRNVRIGDRLAKGISGGQSKRTNIVSIPLCN